MYTYGDKIKKQKNSIFGGSIKHGRSFNYVGILSIVIGSASLFLIQSIEIYFIYVGIVLNVAGLFCFFHLINIEQWNNKKYFLFIAILYIFHSLCFLLKLGLNEEMLKFITMGIFIICGISRFLIASIFNSIKGLRRKINFFGAVSVILAVLLFFEVPDLSLYAFALYTAIEVIINGLTSCIYGFYILKEYEE